MRRGGIERPAPVVVVPGVLPRRAGDGVDVCIGGVNDVQLVQLGLGMGDQRPFGAMR